MPMKWKTINISTALVQFNPSQVNLKQFNATTEKRSCTTGDFRKFFMVLYLENQT
jgi:hypothetical protein